MTQLSRPPARVGDVLPALNVPISVSSVVAMSIATRDFHPVHHDADTARALGHPGLFINIMTTAGLVERFVKTWCGDAGRLAALKLKLGVPHYGGETLCLHGEVLAVGAEQGTPWADVSFSGSNPRGRHASGQVRVVWASLAAPAPVLQTDDVCQRPSASNQLP